MMFSLMRTSLLGFIGRPLLVFALLFVVGQPVEAQDFKQRLKRSTDKARQNFDRARDKATQKTREQMQRSNQKIQQKSQDANRQLQQQSGDWVNRDFPRVSESTKRQLRSISNNLSTAGRQNLLDVYREHGEYAGGHVANMMERHGENTGRAIAKAYSRYGDATGKMLVSTYERYGRDTGANLNQYLKSEGARSAERAEALMRLMGPEVLPEMQYTAKNAGRAVGQRTLEIYEKHGKAVGDRYVAGIRRHGSAGASWVGERLVTVGGVASRTAMDIYKEHGSKYASQFLDQCERLGAPLAARLGDSFEQFVPAAHAATADGLDGEKVLQAAMIAMALDAEIDSRKKSTTLAAVELLTHNVPVQTADGRVINLHEFTIEWVDDNAPYLEGTSIAEDPEKALVYGIVYQDKDYLTQELRVVPSRDGGYVSLVDALYETSPSDPAQTLEVVAALDAATTLTDATVGHEDIYASAMLYSASVNTLEQVEAVK